MSARLASGMLVAALIRQVQARGGNAAVLAKGDADAGGIIVILAQRGAIAGLFERGHDFDGKPQWRPVQGKSLNINQEAADYITRRRSGDPDLWAVELDVADSERFAAEMISMG